MRILPIVLLSVVLLTTACVQRDLNSTLFCEPNCSRDAGTEPSDDAPDASGARDAGRADSGGEDAAVDAGPNNSGGEDAAVDAGQADPGGEDAAVDAGPNNSGGEDAGFDAGRVDAGPEDGGVVVVACGDGVINPPEEQCDDGNDQDGDGCAADCSVVEAGFRCLNPGVPCLRWWNDEARHRIPLTVRTTGSDVPAEYATSVRFDHQRIVSNVGTAEDGSDIHVIRHEPAGGFSELDRYLDPESSWNRADTRLWFRLPEQIDAPGTDEAYYVYVGAGVPPRDDPQQIFLFFEDFSTPSAEWSTSTNGNPPSLVTTATPWDGGSSAVLQASDGTASRSRWARDLPPNTTGRAMTTFFYLASDFDSVPDRDVFLAYYCGANCNDTSAPPVGQMAGISVDPQTFGPSLAFLSTGSAGDDVIVPANAWSRFELSVRHTASSNPNVTAQLRVNESPAGSAQFNFEQEMRQVLIGVFWNDSGSAEVFIDNHWERHFVENEPQIEAQVEQPPLD